MDSGRPQQSTGLGHLLADLRKGRLTVHALPVIDLDEQLRALNTAYRGRQRREQALPPITSLYETLVRLERGRTYQETQQAYTASARQMRQALIDHGRQRRNQGMRSTEHNSDSTAELDIVDVHQLLTELEAMDAEAAHVFELHYFGGHTLIELAALTGFWMPSVIRKLRFAKGWMLMRLRARNKQED